MILQLFPVLFRCDHCLPDAEAELEKRLEKLRTVKGATPYGQGSKADKKPAAASSTAAGALQKGFLSLILCPSQVVLGNTVKNSVVIMHATCCLTSS